MSDIVLADAGPLVALFNRSDAHHDWALSRFREFREPLRTTEPVLTEALHLLGRAPSGRANLLALWKRDLLRVDLSAEKEKSALIALMNRYSNVPASLADASIIRLSEIHSRCKVWTIDGDFRIYRRNGRQAIPVIAPEIP